MIFNKKDFYDCVEDDDCKREHELYLTDTDAAELCNKKILDILQIKDWLPNDETGIKTLLYFSAIKMWAECTSGKYGHLVATGNTFEEIVNRFCRIHRIPGHGKDEFYDSNRHLD